MIYKLFDLIISILALPFSYKTKRINKAIESKSSSITYDDLHIDNKNKDEKIKNIRFKYTVKDREGKIINDDIDALNKVEAESFLINRGYEIIELKEDTLSNKLGLAALTSHKKLSFKNLNFFLTQLSTYIKSGIPLTDAVIILEHQAKKKKDKDLYERIVYELNRGVSFSDALSKQGNVFPKLLINMLKTAELTGDLTDTLDDMANYYATNDANRKQIISAMTYPSVVFVVSIAVLTFVILYVVPKFVGIYDSLGTELPMITKVIINLSDYLDRNIVVIFIVIVFFIVVLTIMYKNLKTFRYAVQWLFMHIPVVKNIIMYKEVIMFTKTFSSLLKHDVFITDSMSMLGRVTNNEIYKELIKDSIVNLSNGNGISPAFRGQWAFPDTAYEMLLTGERTGKLGEMMEHVSIYYEEQQKNLVTQLKGLIEPIMIIFLAVMVGIILLSIIIPMFDMYNSINM